MSPIHRRGQGLSINMLIIIAIGLVVLVLSVLMYTRFVKKGNDTASSCENLGGVCIPQGDARLTTEGKCDTTKGVRSYPVGTCPVPSGQQGTVSAPVCCTTEKDATGG